MKNINWIRVVEINVKKMKECWASSNICHRIIKFPTFEIVLKATNVHWIDKVMKKVNWIIAEKKGRPNEQTLSAKFGFDLIQFFISADQISNQTIELILETKIKNRLNCSSGKTIN